MPRLSPERVIEVRHDTRDQRSVAKDYGVSKSYVGNIRRGEAFTDLPLINDAKAIAAMNNSVARRGRNNSQAKLSLDDIAAIRASKLPSRAEAKKRGVCKSTINNIRCRKNWGFYER